MKRPLISVCMILFIILLPITGFTAQNVRVEMIVLRHDKITALSGEIFPDRLFHPTFNHAHEVIQNKNIGSQSQKATDRLKQNGIQKDHTIGLYQTLGYNHWSKPFKRLDKLLEDNDQYHTLMHVSWRQPIDNSPRTAHIQGGAGYNANGRSMAQSDESPLNDNLYHSVDGAITVEKKHGVNVLLDMVVTQPVADLARPIQTHLKGRNKMVSFELHQKRKIHYNELNYFDHPVYGVLVRVTPETN